MINKRPLPQESGPGEGEEQAVKSLEALTATSLEFTGDFGTDWELLYKWHDRYQKAVVEVPAKDQARVYEETAEFLERQTCWEYRLTTDKDSRYFVSPSGVVLRIKMTTKDPYFKIQPPSRLLGFGSEDFLSAYDRFFEELRDAVFYGRMGERSYRHSDNFIQCFHTKEGKQDTQLTLFGLDLQPKEGLHPIDVKHDERAHKAVEIEKDEGWIRLTQTPGYFPAIHPGNRIVKIDR